MSLPRPDDILSISADSIGEFLTSEASSKRLSLIMKDLNEQLFEQDEQRVEKARRAIRHLGFAIRA